MAAEYDVDNLIIKEFFNDKERGVFLEVGAARPDYLSISESFRSLGWKIIAVEPNPEFCELHRALGYDILEYAASDTESDDADFFVVDSKGAEYMGGSVSYESYSSLGIQGEYAELKKNANYEMSTRKIPVKVRKLDTILALHEPKLKKIDIVAVDVEGWELNVIRGFSLDKYSPDVVILENLFDKNEYIEFMKQRGYRLWQKLNPNDIYVREDLVK